MMADAVMRIVKNLYLGLLLRAALVHSKGCMSIDGDWYNQLGSEMILNHTQAGEIYGQYRTKVERETGASGYGHAKIIGASPYNKPGATIGFAVMFKSGASITAWTGECLVCDGEEVLVSSWLLRERVNTCTEKWKSTRIGQDLFARPRQVNTQGASGPAYNYINDIDISSHGMMKRAVDVPCGLQGTWYNEMGSEVILQHAQDNVITGEYRTAVEVSKGSAGTTHSKVYGLGNVYNGETTFALFVVWRGGASITGWVGQCHLCGPEKTETLEVNWLLRTGVEHCDDNWKATTYGQNSFTRHEPKYGPRKRLGIHTPQQEGEDDVQVDIEKLKSTCSACQHHVTGFIWLLVLTVIAIVL